MITGSTASLHYQDKPIDQGEPIADHGEIAALSVSWISVLRSLLGAVRK